VLIVGAWCCLLTTVGAPVAAAEVDAPGCRTVPVDADAPLRSDQAREVFGVDGTGVTVGVLSTSFATDPTSPTTPDQDIAAGLLPGPGNPCGRTQPVTVLVDATGAGNDEGRAMLELVHGIAPGADLLFASAGDDQFQMAQRIFDLAAAGADIIVDDIGHPQEPTYQPGPIEVAIQDVRAQGVVYLAAVGNNNVIGTDDGPSAGRPIGSWETLEYRPTPCPDTLGLAPGYDCMDFDPGPDTDPTMEFGVGAGMSAQARLTGALNWGEPWYGVQQQFRLYVLQDDQVVGWSPEPDGVTASVEWSAQELVAGAAAELSIVIVRQTPGADLPPPRVKVDFRGDGRPYPTFLEYDQTTGTDIVGPNATGHNAGVGVISVAAADYRTPTIPEKFSNHGPRTLLFGPVDGTVPAAPLSPVQPVAAPSVLSVDGLRTDFYGVLEPDGDRFFYGTSAAAPTVAAVAALGRQLRPGADPDELTRALLDSATPVDSPWPGVPVEDVAGAGLVDATGFLEGLLRVPTAPLDVRAVAGPEPGTATVTFAPPALPGTSPILSYTVRCDGGGRAGTPLSVPDSPAEVTGLVQGAVTTCSVAAVNAQGPGASATSDPFEVTAAPPVVTPTTTTPAPTVPAGSAAAGPTGPEQAATGTATTAAAGGAGAAYRQPPSATLAATGTHAAPLTLAGGLLLTAGTIVLTASRWRNGVGRPGLPPGTGGAGRRRSDQRWW